MNCKNCNQTLNSTERYCNQCGSKVVTQRLQLFLMLIINWCLLFCIDFHNLKMSFKDILMDWD